MSTYAGSWPAHDHRDARLDRALPPTADRQRGKLIGKGFVYRHCKFNVPDPDEFVQFDLYEEQWEVETK